MLTKETEGGLDSEVRMDNVSGSVGKEGLGESSKEYNFSSRVSPATQVTTDDEGMGRASEFLQNTFSSCCEAWVCFSMIFCDTE